jgi:hypothetical protein
VSDAQDNVLSNKTSSQPKTVSAQDIGGGSTPYVMPRQSGTGATRGIQSVGRNPKAFIDASTGTIVLTSEDGGTTVNIDSNGFTLKNGDVEFLTIDSTGFAIKKDGMKFLTIDSVGILLNDGTVNRLQIGEGNFQ